MRRIYLLFISMVMAELANGQLTGTKNIPGDYATLAAAVTDLNAQGVGGGGVILNLVAGNPETAPAGGYSITATGTLADQITIQGNGNIITASAGLTVGSLNDGIFKIIGADYITIKGFTMLENPANSNTVAGTNNMTEWGVALLYATTTNGAQNNTIQNNTIDLNKLYQNTFGIYSNSTHSPTAVTTLATATTVNGGNSGLKIYSNNITDVNMGIIVVGPRAAADHNDGVEIGGSAATGNIVTNYGGTSIFTLYPDVSLPVSGVWIRSSKNYTISHNTITSATPSLDLGGIYIASFSNSPTGTIVNTISNNSLSLRNSGATRPIYGIDISGTSISTLTTLNINSNDFFNSGHVVAASGPIWFITNDASALYININNNTFTNLSVNTTGDVYLIDNGSAIRPPNAIYNVNNNAIVTAFNKTGSGGSLTLYESGNVSFATATEINNNNNFSNITVAGNTTLYGWWCTGDGGGNLPALVVSGNTFNNWTGGTGNMYCLVLGWGGNITVSNNTITNFSCTGNIWGMACNDGVIHISSNTISNLSSSGGGVNGIGANNLVSSFAELSIYKNKINDLQTTHAGSLVNGIQQANVRSSVIYNNYIGNLRAPFANNTNEAIRGIAITGTSPSSTELYYNTVYINAVSAGLNFSTTGIFHSSNVTPTNCMLTSRNNIIVNLSTPKGTGITAAYRRSGADLANYATTSNNNLFYAGTPGPANLIFFDGTNSDQTLAAYKARVSPMDALSVTENPPFLSTSGPSINFLHIDPNVATQVENGAAPIGGITDDYDGDIRNVLTPDIGADEFIGSQLPITLLSFSGYKQGNVNILRWTTANEADNLGFELQRSLDGINYTAIGFVNSLAPGGNSSSQLNYFFTDNNPVSDKQYYRLRQVDIGGYSKFSGIILIKGDKPGALNIDGMFPNPASNTINVIVATPDRSLITLVVTDINGRTLIQKVANVGTGSNTIPIDISRLNNGSYLVKLLCPDCERDGAPVSKFIKQ